MGAKAAGLRGLILAGFAVVHLWAGEARAAAEGLLWGTITSAETGEPLQKVNLTLSGTQRGAATDSTGGYRIAGIPAGTYLLEVSHLGYQKTALKVDLAQGQGRQIDLALQTAVIQLAGLGVTAESASEAEAIRQRPMPVTVLELREYQGRSKGLNELLTRVTGIKIREEGGLGSKATLSIHGLEGKRVAVFINGFAFDSPDGSVSINDIPVEVIERIEVYKGMVPAHLGGDGLGGAINIVTREAQRDLVDLSYSPGSYHTHKTLWSFRKYFAGPGVQLGTGGFFTYAANNYWMDVPNRSKLRVRRNHDAYQAQVIALNTVLRKAWFDEVELEYVLYRNRKELQGLVTDIRHAQLRGEASFVILKVQKRHFLAPGLDLKSTLVVPRLQAQLADTSRFRWNFDGTRYQSPSGRGEVGDTPNDSRDRTQRLANRTNLYYRIRGNQALNLNSQVYYARKEPDDPLAAAVAGYDISGYPNTVAGQVLGLTHEMPLWGGRVFQVFAVKRYHQRSAVIKLGETSLLLEPPETTRRAETRYGFGEGLSLLPNEQVTLKVSMEHLVRLPDEEELFGDGIAIAPASELRPERSNNLNLGVHYDEKGVLGAYRLRAELNGFFMDTADLIKLVRAVRTSSYANLGRVRTIGVEGELKVDLTERLYLYGNGTYQNLRDVRPYTDASRATRNPTYGKRLPNIPWLFANLGGEWHEAPLIPGAGPTRLYVETSYVRGYLYNWELGARDNWRIPGSLTHNLGIQQPLFGKRVTLSAELHNLTNEKVYDVYNQPLPGRHLSVKMRYNWFSDL